MKNVTMKAMVAAAVAASVLAASAAGGSKAKKVAVNEDGVAASPTQAVKINQYPLLGRRSTMVAPGIGGASNIGNVYKKERKWIVLECEYQTFAKALEQLTFTWHVLLETQSATNKDRDGQKSLAPYSYLTTTVTYHNIPRGSHAASVCLHPSYLERFGEAKAVGIVVTDRDGAVITGDTVSEIKGIKGKMFWDEPKIMNATTKGGEPMIERRQGLQDRSKTIWALVNPNDYEQVQ